MMKMFNMTIATLLTMAVMAPIPLSSAGGPVSLMGIDAEDGGPGQHGPISKYVNLINICLNAVNNGNMDILVIGADRTGTNDVSKFWLQVEMGVTNSFTMIEGAANVSSQSFANFAMIAVASDVNNTPSGGLTVAENDALAARKIDIRNFIGNGGGLVGFSSDFGNKSYEYIRLIGNFNIKTNVAQWPLVKATAEGLALGLDQTSLDVCCWHDIFIGFPSFLKPLMLNDLSTHTFFEEASAIGGVAVNIPISNKETSKIFVDANDTMTADGKWTLKITDATPAMNAIATSLVTRVANTTSGNVMDGLSAGLATTFTNGASGCVSQRSTVRGKEIIEVSCPFDMKCILSSTLPLPGTGPTDLQLAPVTFNGFIWQKDVNSIPTVSEWGLATMLLLVMVTGTLVFRRLSAQRVA